MTFRGRIYTLMAGIVALVLVLIGAGWWAAGYMLHATDSAYRQGISLSEAIDTARSAQVNFQRQVQEWKNVLIRGGDAELRARHWQGFEQREAEMNKELEALQQKLGAIGNMQEIAAMALNTRKEHDVLGQRYRAALEKHPGAVDQAAQQAIDVEVRGMDRPTSAGMDSMVDKLQVQVKQRFADEAAAMHSTMQQRFLIAAVVTLVLTALLLALALLVARQVIESIGAEPEDAVAATARISKGDLTQQLGARSPASLLGSLEMMQSRLRNISLAIRQVAHDIEVRATNLPEGAERQTLLGDVMRLRKAIERLLIDR